MEEREIKITIDGQEISIKKGATVMDAAAENGIYIPSLCNHPDLPSVGACRLCITKINNMKGFPTSCTTPVSDGMVITTDDEELRELRKEILSLLLEDHPHACLTCAQREGCTREPCSTNVPFDERCCPKFGQCELQKVVEYVGIRDDTPKYIPVKGKVVESEPLFRRDYNLCIICGRCIRACNEMRGIGTIGFANRSDDVEVATAYDRTFADSGCRFCGACAEVCPTGCITDMDLPSGPKDKVLVPCRSSCPVEVDVPRILNLIAQKRYKDAALVLREALPLPSILGNSCSHPCEESCRRGKVNEPIAISDLEGLVATHDDGSWKSKISDSKTPKNIAVVGSGPAGLSCAYFLRSGGHKVTVFEKEEEAGGGLRNINSQTTKQKESLNKEINDLKDIDIEIKVHSNVEDINSLFNQGFDAVMLATGTGTKPSSELKANEKVFFAGDMASDTKLSIIENIASGKIGAEKIDKFLGGKGILNPVFLEPEPPNHRLGRIEGFAYLKRKDANSRGENGLPVISEEDAVYEAKRCLHCNLRILLSEVVLPPKKWLSFDAQAMETVPENEGVYILIDGEGKTLKIKGTATLKADLLNELESSQAKYFEFEQDPMYSKRESELLQQHLQKYGEMPTGGEDDLDDLF